MTDVYAEKTFEQVIHRIDPCYRLLRAWTLQGGVSARVTALEVARPDGEVVKLLVRQHGAADLQHNPRITADEFRLLQILRAEGLATPAPYYLDESNELFATPYLVLEYIDGQTAWTPLPGAEPVLPLAAHLARIHRLDCSRLDLSFLPAQEQRYTEKLRQRPSRLDESLAEGRIRDVLEAVWPLPQRNPSALLHGDFWPGNVLWRAGELVAVLDWEDAALGDPLADLANSRLEILWAFGEQAMRRFTQAYLALNPLDCANLPCWDLCAALRPASRLATWANDERIEQQMRSGHHLFVTQAFAQIEAQGSHRF